MWLAKVSISDQNNRPPTSCAGINGSGANSIEGRGRLGFGVLSASMEASGERRTPEHAGDKLALLDLLRQLDSANSDGSLSNRLNPSIGPIRC